MKSQDKIVIPLSKWCIAGLIMGCAVSLFAILRFLAVFIPLLGSIVNSGQDDLAVLMQEPYSIQDDFLILRIVELAAMAGLDATGHLEEIWFFYWAVLVTCILFSFGTVIYYIARQLSGYKKGLIIDEKGITDNSFAFSTGFIPWSDIVGFKENKRKIMIYVLVQQPNKYIKSSNVINRILKTIQMKLNGSPVFISSKNLEIEHATVLKHCEDGFEKYGRED